MSEEVMDFNATRKIIFSSSLIAALRVIAHAEEQVASEDAVNMNVQACKIGGQDGLVLGFDDPTKETRKAAICESRTSDHIIIYAGRGRDFDVYTNAPLRGASEHQIKTFDGVVEAARFALEFLLAAPLS